MNPNAKIIPMTRTQIRAEFKKIDIKYDRLKPCGLSFKQLLITLSNQG